MSSDKLDENESKSNGLPLPSYLPSPTFKPPQSKKQKLNLPSPLHMTRSNDNKNNNNSTMLPPPSIPSNISSLSSPSKMDMDAMDVHILNQRLNSLDALVQDQIADNTSNDDDDDDIEIDNKCNDNNNNDTNNPYNDKLIALVNSGSGARKGWILAKELKKYDISVYNLKDLSCNDRMREELGMELLKYLNKCLVLICGGDGSQAWAASVIDKVLLILKQKQNINIPFPPICTFPMGTGNDLSRSTGWGSLQPNHKNILQSIADIQFAAKITKRWSDLDRWRISYTFHDIIKNKYVYHDEELDIHTISEIINDIDSNSSGDIINNNYASTPKNGFAANNNNNNNKYMIKPPKQFYIQQHALSDEYKHIETFDPPLPSTFLCYLSIGYDALVAHKFEKDRRAHPERFNNQIKNQVMYVKHGFSEFFKPSDPITDKIDVIIDGKLIDLPQQCRSLKLININSAMNGLFFWGNGPSREFEYKQQHKPRLDDGLIEVMATRGVHDMIQYRVNVSHAQRISQTNDITIRFKKIPSTGIALQIDGEAWIIKEKLTLQIQIHDKLPVVIGYKEPRGVQSWLQASLEDPKIVEAKNSFRQRVQMKYMKNIKVNTNEIYESESPQSSPAPPTSDDDKTDRNIVDKIINQSSSSIMSLFNINNIIKPNTPKSPKSPNKPNNKTPTNTLKSLFDANEEEKECKEEIGTITPSTPNKHIPNLPFFDNSNESTLSPNNSNKNIIDKIGGFIKSKSRRNSIININNQDIKSEDIEEEQDEDIMEVDIPQYIKDNPSIQNNKNNILQSSIFSPKKKDQNGIFLDRFTWWKVTRAKNHDKAIDAETATDAISPNAHNDIRKTQSFTVLPKKGRSASLF